MTKKRKTPHKNFTFHAFLRTILLSTVLAGIISGCGNKEADIVADTRTPAAAKTIDTAEMHYRESDIPIPDDFEPVAVRFLNREIFLFDSRSVLVMDQEGSELRRTILSENEEFAAFDLQADRSIWAVSSDYGDGEAVSGKAPDAYHFVHISRDGTELARVTAESSGFGEYEDYIYPNRLLVDDEHIYLMSLYTVYVLDKSGRLLHEYGAAGGYPRIQGMFKSLFKLDDGRIALASIVYGNETSSLIRITEPENQETEEISIAANTEIVTAGKDAAILLCTNNGFYHYEPESGEQRLVFDNMKYLIVASNLVEASVLPDDSIAIAEGTPERKVSRLTRFIPFDPSEVSDDSPEVDYRGTDRQVVTLSVVNWHSTYEWLTKAIADFNRSNKYYYVEAKNYYQRTLGGDEHDDRDDAYTRLNLDLIAGNITDIIVLPNRMSPRSYISKGLFADLNTFIDNDPDFNRDDYVAGLFEALDWGGKIYEIFPLLDGDGIKAKTIDVGTEHGWTLDEFAAYLDANPNTQYPIGTYTKSEFITMMVEKQFINPLTGEAKFDRLEFAKILKIAERFPDTIPNNLLSYLGYPEFMSGSKDGDPLTAYVSLNGFTPMHRNYFGEEATIMGWPSSAGNGLQFNAWDYFSISARAENPDGAWAFLKYTMDHAYCKYGSGMSVNLSFLEKQAAEYHKREDEFKIDKATTDKYIAMLNEIRSLDRGNRPVSRILREEIESYLSGQKPADDVADIIENRIGIYLAEQE